MKRQLQFDYEHYDSLDELTADDRRLLESAFEACQGAYAPYSGYRVGAAVRLSSGEVLTASNQESEVFPSGMCAERSLLYYVQGNRPHDAVCALAIISPSATTVCTPCGGCRQVIADTEKRQQRPIRIIMGGKQRATIVGEARQLLPFTFELE